MELLTYCDVDMKRKNRLNGIYSLHFSDDSPISLGQGMTRYMTEPIYDNKGRGFTSCQCLYNDTYLVLFF